MTCRTAILATTLLAPTGPAVAVGCDTIAFLDVGWTDIIATTAATALVY